MTQNAHTTFTQLQTTHIKNVTANANEAVKGFQKVTTGIDTLFDKIDQHLEQGFKKSAKGLEDGLRGALKGLESDIQKYGDKAAAEVQPRWKSVLKVVLIIAVLVVVAFVMGPLLVGLGPLATIAVGALVGAASGAVIQMGNNLIDGKNLMDGVGQAALIGAIGGVLGGAGGLLGKGLANAAGKLLSAGLTQSLLKGGITVGADAASNVASGIAGDLLQGKPLTLQALLDSAIQGAAFSIGMGLFSKIKTVKVDEPTVKPQEPTIKVNEPTVKPQEPTVKVNEPTVKPQEPTVKVNEPTVKPQEPTVKTTDTPNGRSTHMDEPEIEPGVVAKEPTADGHEIKVLKDGRVVRCSDCAEIRSQYEAELNQRPDLKARLDQIEQESNPQEKAEQAKQLTTDSSTGQPAEPQPLTPEMNRPRPAQATDELPRTSDGRIDVDAWEVRLKAKGVRGLPESEFVKKLNEVRAGNRDTEAELRAAERYADAGYEVEIVRPTSETPKGETPAIDEPLSPDFRLRQPGGEHVRADVKFREPGKPVTRNQLNGMASKAYDQVKSSQEKHGDIILDASEAASGGMNKGDIEQFLIGKMSASRLRNVDYLEVTYPDGVQIKRSYMIRTPDGNVNGPFTEVIQ